MKQDWIESKLGNFCNFIGGGTPSKRELSFWHGDIPWASIKDLKGNFLTKTSDFITQKGLDNSSSNLAMEDDIILATRINPGKPMLSKIEVAVNQDLKIVKPKIEINKRFLFYGFLTLEKEVLKKSSGTTVLGINLNNLKEIPFSFPSLPEQRAIVAIIEQLFSELENGIANLKTAQEQLKIYRQAVLKKAFEGEWEKTFVGELFDFVGGGTPSKREKEYWNGTIPWASVKDIKGDYLKKTQEYITEEGVKNSSTNIAYKDEVILITRISPGKTLITDITVAVNQDLKIIKPKFKTYNVFIHYLFKSIEWDIVKLSSGTTVLGINLTNLKAIEIPKIKLKEQHQIVQQIESRLSVCDKVEETIAENLQKAEALRQSILKKAFEGKLLSEEEIEACKKEKDWEPAGELLEKLKNKN